MLYWFRFVCGLLIFFFFFETSIDSDAMSDIPDDVLDGAFLRRDVLVELMSHALANGADGAPLFTCKLMD